MVIKEDKKESPFKQKKLTTIVGIPADKIINAMNRGEQLIYVDDSVEGVPILQVYHKVDSEFWSLREGEKWEDDKEES